MNDPERTIEDLLAGLRDAEPPPGMHHRILDAMVARRATAHRPRRLLYTAVAISLACALAITIWVQRHTPANPTSYTANVDASRTKPPQRIVHITPRESRRSRPRVLLRPTQTPGFPAPPLPLTQQEKLLLYLAHRKDAEDMNLLNPNVQAQQSAKTTQQFQEFFEMNADQMRSESE